MHLNQHQNVNLFQVVFPISFESKFYKDILRKEIECKLAYLNNMFVGAITYKIQEKGTTGQSKSSQYML